MSWTRTKQTGSGTLAYRLELQRCTRGFVTHASMIKAGATPPRIAGLKVRGGKLKSIANIASGELDVSGLSCSIVDLGETATGVFGLAPSARTWITADVTAAATSMNVRSTGAFASTGTIWLDSEAMTYSGITATSFTGLTRGALSTVAQAHFTSSGGSLRFPEVTNTAQSYAGARATLYVYGDTDDPQGNGTAIWRGVVSREPTYAGGSWNIPIDPITSVLARAVGADLGEPLAPRGIYYPAHRPFSMTLFLGNTSTVGDPATSKTIRFPTSSTDTAFFESQADFITYLNTKIATATSGWTTSVVAVADGEDTWHLQITTDGTPKAVWCLGVGGIDPVFLHPSDDDGNTVLTMTGSATYAIRGTSDSLPGAGSVPRGYVGEIRPGETPVGVIGLGGTFPSKRIYVGGVASVSSFVTAAAINFPAFGTDEERDVVLAASGSASPRYVAIRSALYMRGFTAAALPEIRLGRTYAEDGSVWTALSAMISAAPSELNAGSIPDIQSADFDTASWAELDESWQPRVVRSRWFTSFADVPLMDLVREELKLAGYALGISATGTLSIFRLRRPVGTEAAAAEIGAFAVDKSLPTWSASGVGLVNTMKVDRQWDPVNDEYAGPACVVRDVAAYGQSPRPRLISVSPKSQCFPIEGNAELVECAQRTFGVLAFPYAIVQADVGLRFFDSAVPGASALVTSPHLPNTSNGTRGVTALPTLVTGREVDLDSGRISLTLYVPIDRASGYAPAAKVSSQVNTSGDTWEITLTTTTFPSGTDASDWFIAGDNVRVYRWDSTTAGTIGGTVDSVSGNVVTVTFASAWTPSSDAWVLAYTTSDSYGNSSQLAYVYLADSAGRVDDGGDGLDAWGFA